MVLSSIAGLPPSGWVEYDPNNSTIAQHEIIGYQSLNAASTSIVGLTRGMFGTSALSLTSSSFIEYFDPIFAFSSSTAPMMAFEAPDQLGFGQIPVMPISYGFVGPVGTTGVGGASGAAFAVCNQASTCTVGPAGTVLLKTNLNGVFLFSGGTATDTVITPYTNQMLRLRDANNVNRVTVSSTATTIIGNLAITGSSTVSVTVPTGALLAAQCNSATTTIDSAYPTSTSKFFIGPQVDAGDQYYYKAFIAKVGELTAKVCAVTAGTPATTTLNIGLSE